MKPKPSPLVGREMVDALEERGEKLDFLSENLDKATKASTDFVSQARRMAMVQSAKGAAGGAGFAAKGAFSSIGNSIGKMLD